MQGTLHYAWYGWGALENIFRFLWTKIEIWKQKNAFCKSLQREKDEAIGELEAVKDRMEMTQASHNRAVEEKDMINKELERLLEKYDR